LEKLFNVLVLLHRGTPKHGEWVVACLEGAWPGLLGERLAAKCRPVRFEDSELVIEMLDSDWATAINGVKPVLLEKLRAATAGEVKTIAVADHRRDGGDAGN
jgi:hypothetical protein